MTTSVKRKKSWIASLVAGPVIGLSSIVNLLGGAALAFPAALSSHIGVVIGTMLAGSIVAAAYSAVRAGLSGTLMESQEAPAMLLGLMGVAVYASLPVGLDETERVAVVIAAFAVATVTTGLFFWLLGWLRLGELIRYIPFPVIGGVLAGLGLLMMEGALSVVTGLSITGENLAVLFGGEMLARWVPALLFAAVIGVVNSRSRHFLTIPALLAAAAAVFFGIVFVSGGSLDQVAENGWLLGPFPQGSLFQAVDYAAILRIDGSVLLAMIPKIASVILISTIGLLLHASGLELAAREEIELNRELRNCGIGNIGAGLFGGVPIFHSLSSTLLTRTMGAANVLTPLIVVGFWIFILIFGGSVLGYFPRPVLAGLLLFLGGSLLWEWLVQGKSRLPFGDWLVVVMIVVTVAFVGYMQGIGLGVVAGVILFQISYTKIDVVKHALSGREFRSHVDRAEQAMTALHRHGQRILALQLQSYIYFGTANNVLLKLRDIVESDTRSEVGWLVIDFRQVAGLDWAAVMSFRKVLQLAEKVNLLVAFSGLDEKVRKTLEKGEIIGEAGGNRLVFDTLDGAMEWCEDRLLDELAIASGNDISGDMFPALMTRAFPDSGDQARLRAYLEILHCRAGEKLMCQGEKSDSSLVIQMGRASVHVEDDDGHRIRVKSYHAGSLIGEIGLYSGAPRTATVTADTDVRAFVLSRERFEAMRAEAPDLAGRFDELVVDLLGKRLSATNQLVASLLT